MTDSQLLQIMAQIYLAAACVASDAPSAAICSIGLLFGLVSAIYVWRGK